MSLRGKLLRNLFIIVVAAVFLFLSFGLHFTPEAALHARERGMGYLPSQVLYTVETEEGVRLFSARGKRFSFLQVDRALGLFWHIQNSGFSTAYDTKPLFYHIFNQDQEAERELLFYGYRNDPAATSVVLHLRDGRPPITLSTWRQDWVFLHDATLTESDVWRVTLLSAGGTVLFSEELWK